jgi:hypothetical protein
MSVFGRVMNKIVKLCAEQKAFTSSKNHGTNRLNLSALIEIKVDSFDRNAVFYFRRA